MFRYYESIIRREASPEYFLMAVQAKDHVVLPDVATGRSYCFPVGKLTLAYPLVLGHKSISLHFTESFSQDSINVFKIRKLTHY